MPKFFFKSKDGGPQSNVTGYWLIECKSLFSIVLLRFDKGSREAFHNHAFNAVSWVLKGKLKEIHTFVGSLIGCRHYLENYMSPSLFPISTHKDRMHQVHGVADTTWVLSFRGPWNKTWKEYLPKEDKEVTLSSGRIIVEGD